MYCAMHITHPHLYIHVVSVRYEAEHFWKKLVELHFHVIAVRHALVGLFWEKRGTKKCIIRVLGLSLWLPHCNSFRPAEFGGTNAQYGT